METGLAPFAQTTVTQIQSLPPRVSVIIINFNGRPFLDELLDSLRKQTLQEFETFLIDNNSQDESAPYVRNNFPWVRVLAQSRNLGFAGAGNLGAKVAKADYVVTLNPDVKLDPGWLKALTAKADQDHSVAAVASKMRLYDKLDTLNGVGGTMNYLGYTWDRGMFEKDHGQYDRPEEVLFASAGAALFRRSLYLESGGFDEKFFMYHEDVDLCWRFWLFGFRVITAPDAVVYHHFGGSTRKAAGMDWRELIGERNSVRALIKNYQMRNLIAALRDLILLPQRPRRKWGQIKNLAWNFVQLADTLKRRRWIQKRRRRQDRELQHLIVQSSDVPIRL